MQGGRVKKLMFCYSDNVEKELKYNQSIFNSLTDSRASPKEQCCSEEMGIQSFEIRWRQSWWRHCHFFCATTTQPKFTPTNHHLLINIHHLSLGHQGLPRLHQSLEKPPATTPQEGFRGHGEGGGGKEVQGSLWSKERSFSNCCLTSCPPWTSWNGGSITSPSSPFLPSSSRWSSQCQLLHLNLIRSFQVKSWKGGGPCSGEVQLEVA